MHARTTAQGDGVRVIRHTVVEVLPTAACPIGCWGPTLPCTFNIQTGPGLAGPHS